MAITIQGIRISRVVLDRDGDGKMKMSGNYELMGPNGIVVAKQTVGGYNDMVLTPSPDLYAAECAYIDAFKNDLNKLLGVE